MWLQSGLEPDDQRYRAVAVAGVGVAPGIAVTETEIER